MNQEDNKISKFYFNGMELTPSNIDIKEMEFKITEPSKTIKNIREIKSAEIAITLSRWQIIKLSWIMFKAKYLSKETTYVIKIGKRDEGESDE